MEIDNIRLKYETYVKNHPEMKLATSDMVASIMVDKGILTAEEYE